MGQDRTLNIQFYHSKLAGQTTVNLIANTTTTGVVVKAMLDTNIYPTKVEVTDQQRAALPLKRETFHGK